jgi:hypothetical protein
MRAVEVAQVKAPAAEITTAGTRNKKNNKNRYFNIQ